VIGIGLLLLGAGIFVSLRYVKGAVLKLQVQQ
jgi:hypothetical protein